MFRATGMSRPTRPNGIALGRIPATRSTSRRPAWRLGSRASSSSRSRATAESVDVEPYIGADGHLVALREGDLAYLHVHPTGGGHGGEGEHGQAAEQDEHAEEAPHGEPVLPISFETTFPSEARYALFLQFKDEGKIHTAQFGTEVGL